VKLAAMILAWDRLAKAAIPYDHSKRMTTKQINALIQFDHDPVRHADGGTDHPSNLTPRYMLDHLEKTKADATDMARERRVRRAQAAHEDALVVKSADPGSAILSALKPMEWTRWPSRPFSKRQRRS
jgi:hypothetical protein